MAIKMIAVVDGHGAIGRENGLLAHLPDDWRFFMDNTIGHGVLMGRKTYESLPSFGKQSGGKHLPRRYNFVLTRQPIFYGRAVETLGSVEEALFIAESVQRRGKDFWIIGGAEIYDLFSDHVDEVYLTYVNHVFPDADAFFPLDFLRELESTDKWDYESLGKHEADERHAYSFEFVKYTRIKGEETS